VPPADPNAQRCAVGNGGDEFWIIAERGVRVGVRLGDDDDATDPGRS
jgi:hypothetical protein